MSKKQSIIADSRLAAEFIDAHTGAQAIMWARNFLEELLTRIPTEGSDLHVQGQPHEHHTASHWFVTKATQAV